MASASGRSSRSGTEAGGKGRPSRRRLLRSAAIAAGAAIGSGALRGFPTIRAQNIKNVTLIHIGLSAIVIKQIGDQATEDLGFTVKTQAVDPASQLQRLLEQPKSLDINECYASTNKYLEDKGVLRPIAVRDYKLWDKTLSMFTTGKFRDGRSIPNQGMSPIKAGFWDGSDGRKLAGRPTDWLTMVPTMFNADSLGIRPDLVGGRDKVTSWGDLLDPKYQGKAALCDLAAVGAMDAAMALEARGDVQYGDKGNMTRAEIDKTFEIMKKMKRDGQFRAFWTNFDQSVNLMASGEVVIQSVWSPAVTAVKARGIPCDYAPLKEGYRGWTGGIAPMAHLSGLKLDCAMQYLNWYNSGWVGGFLARQGFYSTVPETARKFLTRAEWDYWYDGKPAAMWEREERISVWNTVMDEDRYLTRRSIEFIAG
jgi:putative spermidine/putrescine transport system substrate-binding protein